MEMRGGHDNHRAFMVDTKISFGTADEPLENTD